MDSSMGGADHFGHGDNHNSPTGERPSYKRLSSTQVDILEKFMRECPHPNESQQCQLAAEVGVEPKQIKFWFQNKRTQLKIQHEREDNNALRIENDNIKNENRKIRDQLKNILCPSCGGPPCRADEHEQYMQRMHLENDMLKAKYESVYSFLTSYLENQISQPELHALLSATIGSSLYALGLGSSVNQAIDQVPNPDPYFSSQALGGYTLLPHISTMLSTNMQKSLMVKLATTAMDELLKLMHINEPLWIKSSAWDEKFILSREDYEKIFPRSSHFKGPNIRVESSKCLAVVSMRGMDLVDRFLDSDKWAYLFPTIVMKAKTIHVIDNGFLENRSGALKMMYGKMHTMSHLVPAREFCFLRHCQHLGVGKWMITDVSFDPFGGNNPISHCWRHPSGCMIQEMNTGCSMVTWIEHVEVDDNKIQTHPLYKDLVSSSVAYGAERWIKELKRICERLTLYYVDMIPNHDASGVVNLLEGRRSMMNLSHRMVKLFCENLIISDKLNFPQLAGERDSGVKVCFRKCTSPGQPHGTIVIAVTSLWLPFPYSHVYDFLIDDTRRFQWDVLCSGSTVDKIAQIPTGNQPDNYISIIQPFVPTENNMLILQESFIDSIGSYVVYAPIDRATLDIAIKGKDSTLIPILPSGFVISRDGKPNAALGASSSRDVRRSGSLLTMALQTLVCSQTGITNLDMGSVSMVIALLTSTVEKIKVAMNCNSVE